MNDEVFECVVNSPEEMRVALDELKPTKFKTRAIVRLENKFGAVERIMNVRQVKLLFRNSLSMTLFVKNILASLKTSK